MDQVSGCLKTRQPLANYAAHAYPGAGLKELREGSYGLLLVNRVIEGAS
jgi:hypothetical protein